MKSRRETARVWHYFIRTTSAEGRPVCVCTLCQAALSDTGTSNLAKHLAARHRDLSDTALPTFRNIAPKSRAEKQGVRKPYVFKVKEENQSAEEQPAASDEPLGAKISVTQFFEETDVPGCRACIYCGCKFSGAGAREANLLSHLRVKHDGDIAPQQWTLLGDGGGGNLDQNGLMTFGEQAGATPVSAARRSKAQDVSGLGARPSGVVAWDGSYQPNRRSIIWRYFKQSSASEDFMTCRLCGKDRRVGLGGSTSGFLQHLRLAHPNALTGKGPLGAETAPDSPLNNEQPQQLQQQHKMLQQRVSRCGNSALLDSDTGNSVEDTAVKKDCDGVIDDNETMHEEDLNLSVEGPDSWWAELDTMCGCGQILGVRQLWRRHCVEREREYQTEVATLKRQAAEYQGRVTELRRLLSEVTVRRRDCKARRHNELSRQRQLDRQLALALVGSSNGHVAGPSNGHAVAKKKSARLDSAVPDVSDTSQPTLVLEVTHHDPTPDPDPSSNQLLPAHRSSAVNGWGEEELTACDDNDIVVIEVCTEIE